MYIYPLVKKTLFNKRLHANHIKCSINVNKKCSINISLMHHKKWIAIVSIEVFSLYPKKKKKTRAYTYACTERNLDKNIIEKSDFSFGLRNKPMLRLMNMVV